MPVGWRVLLCSVAHSNFKLDLNILFNRHIFVIVHADVKKSEKKLEKCDYNTLKIFTWNQGEYSNSAPALACGNCATKTMSRTSGEIGV